MRLIAIVAQLTGEYGTVTAGQEFEARDEIATQLVRTGHARRAEAPRVLYDTKVVVPEAPEVSARPGFRTAAAGNMHLSDPKPPGVASAGHPLLDDADVSKPGAADNSRRRGRSGSGTDE